MNLLLIISVVFALLSTTLARQAAVLKATSSVSGTAKCEFLAADGSYYDLSPLTIRTRAFWNKAGGGDAAKGADPSHLRRSRQVDASVSALSYWSTYFDQFGTVTFNPCGVVQNQHEDCPSDVNGAPTQSLVLLRHLDQDEDDVLDDRHRQQHCQGFGHADSVRFEGGESGGEPLRIRLSGGTDGREALVDLVCGTSTGEVTAANYERGGRSPVLHVTFVSKYACAKQSGDSSKRNQAELDAARLREKQADKKARAKLAATMNSMQQARLLHPKPKTGRAAAAKPKPVPPKLEKRKGAISNGLERMQALSRETVGRRPASHRAEVLNSERSAARARQQQRSSSSSSAASKDVDIYRALLAKKRSRELRADEQEQRDTTVLANDDDRGVRVTDQYEDEALDETLDDAVYDELEESVARERRRRERAADLDEEVLTRKSRSVRTQQDSFDYEEAEQRLRRRQQEEWEALKAKREAQRLADMHHSGAPLTKDRIDDVDDDYPEEDEELGAATRRQRVKERMRNSAHMKNKRDHLDAVDVNSTMWLGSRSAQMFLLALILIGAAVYWFMKRMRDARQNGKKVFERPATSSAATQSLSYQSYVESNGRGPANPAFTTRKDAAPGTAGTDVTGGAADAVGALGGTAKLNLVSKAQPGTSAASAHVGVRKTGAGAGIAEWDEESSEDEEQSLLPPAPGGKSGAIGVESGGNKAKKRSNGALGGVGKKNGGSFEFEADDPAADEEEEELLTEVLMPSALDQTFGNLQRRLNSGATDFTPPDTLDSDLSSKKTE